MSRVSSSDESSTAACTGGNESGPREKRSRTNTVRQKKRMRNARKKRMRQRRAELRQAETDRLRSDLEYERREHHKSECKVKVYKSMSRTYWERWRWELQKRKEAMKETMLAQRRHRTQSTCPQLAIQQIDPSMLVDAQSSDVS